MLDFSVSIPNTIRTPGTYVGFSNQRAGQDLSVWQTRILILGQALGTGTAPNLVPQLISSEAQGIVLFGRGSMLAAMIAALIDNNSSTELWAMSAADNGAGVAATFTATVTAAPTGAGTLALYIGGVQVQVAVTAAETVTAVATAIAAAINADADLPVTAASAVGVVTLTCRWKGLTGNDIDLRTNYYASDVMPAGLAITFAAGVAGAGNPVIAPVVAALGDTQYQFIANPWTDGASLAAIQTELVNRWGPLEQIEGFAFSSAKGSQGTLATLGESLNTQLISISECVGPATTWERAAREVGVIALYGAQDPARPFQTLPLAGDLPGNPGERFTRAQRDVLLHDGISTHTVDSGGNVLLERPITTYQTNAQNLPDASYLDVNTVLTLAYLRYDLRAMISSKYARYKLADDGIAIAPGQAIVTPKVLKAEIVARALAWETAGLVENVDEFKQLIIVERSNSDPSRINAMIPPDIVSGLRVFAGQINFAL